MHITIMQQLNRPETDIQKGWRPVLITFPTVLSSLKLAPNVPIRHGSQAKSECPYLHFSGQSDFHGEMWTPIITLTGTFFFKQVTKWAILKGSSEEAIQVVHVWVVLIDGDDRLHGVEGEPGAGNLVPDTSHLRTESAVKVQVRDQPADTWALVQGLLAPKLLPLCCQVTEAMTNNHTSFKTTFFWNLSLQVDRWENPFWGQLFLKPFP